MCRRRSRDARFVEAVEWIKASKPLVPDGNGGQEWVNAHADNIDERIGKVDSVWASKGPEWQAQHTLTADDGYLASELSL